MLKFPFSGGKIWAFVASYFCSGTAWGMMTLLLPTYAVSLKATAQSIGMIQGAWGVGLALAVIPAGFLIDRLGSRSAFVLSGLAIAVVVLLLPSLKQDLFLLALIAIGAISAFNMTAINAAFLKNLASMGQDKAGWYKGSLAVGLSLVGPIVAGLTIKTYGFRPAFMAVALLWIVPALSALALTNASPLAKRTRQVFNPIFQQAKHLVTNRFLLGACGLEGLGIATVGIFSTFIAVLSLSRLQLNSLHVGWLLSLEGIGYVAILFCGGKLLFRFSRKGLATVGFAGAGLAFFLLAVAPGFTMVALGSAALGLALGLLGLITMSVLTQVNADNGSVVGFHGFSMGAFGAIGPVVGGLIGKARGLEAIFWSGLVFYGALTVLAVIVGLLRQHRVLGQKEELASAIAEPPSGAGVNTQFELKARRSVIGLRERD